MNTIKKYTVSGVPESLIPELMKELNLNEQAFYDFMKGQTMAVIGNEAIYYAHDIERFIKGLPNND